MMKRVLGMLAAAGAATVGCLGVGLAPASADVPPANFTCSARRPNSSYTVVYANYDLIDPQGRFVRAECVGSGNLGACRWYATYWSADRRPQAVDAPRPRHADGVARGVARPAGAGAAVDQVTGARGSGV